MQKITFPSRSEFSKTLRKRVDQYFKDKGIQKTGNWRMWVKTALILLWLASSYILLVWFSASFIMAVISTIAVAQGFVMVGFNIMHDGNHGSYSRNKRVNWIMGFTIDLIGGSSTLWKQKHNILHHTYTNINNVDDDLDTQGLLRLSPKQEWRPWHRFQHIYALPVYSLLSITWMTFNDFKKFFSGKIGEYKLRKFTITETTLFFIAKIFYFSYMLVIPAFFHPILYVLLGFIAVHLVVGITTSVVFQLAHTMDENEFPEPDEETGNIENEWAIHQVETTVNFAPRNKFLTWYLGGLNYQIEHHLFSKVCHVHYPAISKIVKQTCQEYSIPYVTYPTFRSAIFTHMKFLKRLSKKEAMA